MRKKITLPGAGELLSVPMTGKSVIIEVMPVYKKLADVPLLSVVGSGFNSLPMYPRSIYGNGKEFNQLQVEGTEESDGDTAYLLTVDECLQTDLNIFTASQYEAQAGTTFAKTASDAVQSFTELELINADGELPKSVTITARDNPIAYAFNADPDQSNFGHILINADQTAGSEREVQNLEIEGIDFILSFNFINAVNASNAELIVTPRY